MGVKNLGGFAVAATILAAAGCGNTSSGRILSPEELGIDMSTADRCDWLVPSRCMLPLPNDFYTVADPDSPTGRRVDFPREAMPANSKGIHVDPTEWNRNDGFSPGSAVLVHFPGVDAVASGVAPIEHIGRHADPGAPVVEIDAETGERHPIWVEIDSNAKTDDERTLIVRQAKNLVPGRRYVVAFRRLVDRAGRTFEPSPGFAIYRDGVRTSDARLEARRAHMDDLFSTLERAGVARGDLQLAFDFTVASDEGLTGRLRHMRDDAFAALGDAVPAFKVDRVREPYNDTVWRRVEGTFEIPLYMTGDGVPGSSMAYGSDGLPARQAKPFVAPFRCVIPPSAAGGGAGPVSPTRTVVYGHGLLGDFGELGSDLVESMVGRFNMTYCGTNWIGMADEDIGNAVNILGDVSTFGTLADRLQQGLLNNLFLARLMKDPRGFASDPAFRLGDVPVIGSEVYYDGNSQGAILGGAFLAISQDVTRGVLGEAGMNYSLLLQRSVDWDDYKLILEPAYPDTFDQLLVIGLIQMLWDRGETNGWAHRIGENDPLPGSPPKKVLLLGAVGDHQVSEYALQVEARTIGASGHFPAAAPERLQGEDKGWGIPAIGSYPFDGSAWFLFDTRSPLSPLVNLPPREGHDPHDDTPNIPIAQDLKDAFLRSDGLVTDVCGRGPCVGEPQPD